MFTSVNSSPAARVHLTLELASRIAFDALVRVGYDDEDAEIVTAHLIDAAACGYEYSGLPKILEIVEAPRAKYPRHPVKWLRETRMSALLDGGNNVGMVTMHHATDRVIALAQSQGFAMVGVTRSWMSGRSAYYMERVARNGLVGFHTVSSASLVAPPGGARPSIGTNPIAFGFPCYPDPLIIDIGTSAIMGTEFGLIRRRGGQLPDNVALDSQGRPTRDAEAARAGAFLSMAGHKEPRRQVPFRREAITWRELSSRDQIPHLGGNLVPGARRGDRGEVQMRRGGLGHGARRFYDGLTPAASTPEKAASPLRQ